MTIESLDARITTEEHQAGLALLQALRQYREAPGRLTALRLRAAEAIYDRLPVGDRQIRDGLDDALMCAGWERMA